MMGGEMHTKDFLAQELRAAGLGDMAIRAAQGLYHDYLSPLPFPEMELMQDLQKAARTAPSTGLDRAAILNLIERHKSGEFDASAEESDAWAASPEGQAAFGQLLRRHD
jgi:hypothetical protein